MSKVLYPGSFDPITKGHMNIIDQAIALFDKVTVITAKGAAVDVAIENDCSAIVRGLRGITDFDYEISMQQVNKEISDYKVNTICFFADPNYQFLSSSMVKEVFILGKDISRYVDDSVQKKMEAKTYGSKNVR